MHNYEITKTLLIKPGELMLKGDNRHTFNKKLIDNLKSVLNMMCKYDFDNSESGRYYVHITESSYTEYEIAEELSKVFGIVGISISYRIGSNEESIYSFLCELASSYHEKTLFHTFKVETKRADKAFPISSLDISKIAGGRILDAVSDIKVDVLHPEVVFRVEIRKYTYIYCEEVKANGGMPVGSAGKAILLLSGGIDSPVAGYMMSKRGLSLEAVYFHSEPYTSEKAKEKVVDLAKIIKPYTQLRRLHVVHFTEPQLQIYRTCPHDELTIIMRRVMMFITNAIAAKTGCQGIITGESLGQVASQTIESLTVTNASASLIVLRPLIGMDKNEIIDIARKIGTFETSILPYEDCCTIFVAKHPKTKPVLEHIVESEKVLDIDKIVKNCVDNIEVINL
jgi:thiamine biosynthesis protein ThiI